MANLGSGNLDLEFLQAVMKRGLVNIPRMVFDYTADLGLDYDTIGKMFAVMASVGGPSESAFGSYRLTRQDYPHDFDQLKSYIAHLQKDDLVSSEDEGDHITFTFIPLWVRLRAIWSDKREQFQELTEDQVHPAIRTAERLLVTLSGRAVQDIQDWVDTYGYGPDMVEAVIREGQRLGITRMSYLNQVARQWFEEGIQTPDQAAEYVQRYRKTVGKHKAIVQYLGLKRQLTSAEQTLLEKWTGEWGFSNEVIFRACDQAIGKDNPLQYANRVLESWLERGVRSVADAERLLQEYKRSRSPQQKGARPGRKPEGKSNVFLQREKKDEDNYYDYLYKDQDD